MASSSSSTTSKTDSSTSSKSGSQTQGSSLTQGSSQTTGSSQTWGGSSSTTNSHTTGGSHSVSNTQGGSSSDTISKGGANSQTYGKSWASGTVDADIQAAKKYYENAYQQSQQVQDTYDRLQNTLNNKPGAFSSAYTDKLNSLYDQLMNRGKFSYNFNADPMYQMYREQYTQQGKQAMQDTMGQAAALTGGYGSSYSQTAGQQTYQNYLQQLNDIIPELRNQAYQEWQAEGEDLKDKYNLTQSAYNNEYNQYRDTVSDWQQDRSFDQNTYDSERNFDYGQFSDNRNYLQQEYWNQRNAEQSNLSNTDQANWSQAHTDEKNWSTSTTDTSSWSDTSSTTNSTNWSNSLSNQATISNQATVNNSATTGWQTSNSTSTTNQNTTSYGGSSGSSGGSSSKSSSNSYNALLKDQIPNDYKSSGLTEISTNNVAMSEMLRSLDGKTDKQKENLVKNYIKNGYKEWSLNKADVMILQDYASGNLGNSSNGITFGASTKSRNSQR